MFETVGTIQSQQTILFNYLIDIVTISMDHQFHEENQNGTSIAYRKYVKTKIKMFVLKNFESSHAHYFQLNLPFQIRDSVFLPHSDKTTFN